MKVVRLDPRIVWLLKYSSAPYPSVCGLRRVGLQRAGYRVAQGLQPGQRRVGIHLIALIFHRQLLLLSTALLVVISLDDVACHPSRAGGAVLAPLHQHGDYNLRLPPGRIADDPGIVFEPSLPPAAL